MTNAIYSWMRNLAYYYLFYSIVMNLLPDKQYSVYIKNFLGILLIILLLSPVLKLFQLDTKLESRVRIESFREAFDNAVNGELAAEEQSNDYLLYAYEKEIESQISQLFVQHGFEVWDIQVSLEGEEEVIVKQIYVLAGDPGEEVINSVGTVVIKPDTENEKAEEIKKELQEVYQMDVANIIINIQE